MRAVSAFIGLGSNVGDRLHHLKEAVRLLDTSSGLRFANCSSVYDTDPIGPPQATFLNAVVEVHTTLGPRELLERCKAIEAEIGRRERGRWGPREVDLDVLLYGTKRVLTEDLQVPHPELSRRGFVLVPLADVAPFARVPGLGRVVELLERVGSAGVRYAHPPEALAGRPLA